MLRWMNGNTLRDIRNGCTTKKLEFSMIDDTVRESQFRCFRTYCNGDLYGYWLVEVIDYSL